MPAKQTYIPKAERVQAHETLKKFGAEKTKKAATTANYKFVLPKELEGQPGIDEVIVSGLVQVIETGFKEFSPMAGLYCKRHPHVYVDATGFSNLFVDKIDHPPLCKEIGTVLQHKHSRHILNHLALASGRDAMELYHAIHNLTPEQVMLIINNAWKFSGETGIAVPVFYYLEEGEGGYARLLVNFTRYLDFEENIEEAQYKLANGLTKNRAWAVWPEHMEAYESLKAAVAAKKAQKKAEADKRFAEMGEDHGTDEEIAEKIALARAQFKLLNKPPV